MLDSMKEVTLRALTKELFGVEVTIYKGEYGYYATGLVIGKVRSSLGYEATLRQLWFAIEHNIHAIRTVYELNTGNREALEFIPDAKFNESVTSIDSILDVTDEVKVCGSCKEVGTVSYKDHDCAVICSKPGSPRDYVQLDEPACGMFTAKTPQSES